MPKGIRTPVAYNDLKVGHWYQARFDFRDAADNTTTAGPSTAAPTSDSRAKPRNKSHRVFVVAKYPNRGSTTTGHAICLFLTSFGGRLDESMNICSNDERLNFLPVNSTKSLVSVYRSLPISVKALYGYLNFTSEYKLPVGVAGNSEAIVRMKEAGKSGVDVTSPDWVGEYIYRLKVAWVKSMWAGEIEDKWTELAEKISAEFGGGGGEAKVAQIEGGDSKAEAEGESGGAKRLRGEEARGDDGAKKRRLGPLWVDGAIDESNDNDGDNALDMGAEVQEGVCPAFPRATPLQLLNVDFYESDANEQDIDHYVDFPLLDALFRPFPF